MRGPFCCAAILFTALAAAASAQGRSATLILLNGRIWTENPRHPEAEAVAIDGQHLLAVACCYAASSSL